jgi:hypothetical protein
MDDAAVQAALDEADREFGVADDPQPEVSVHELAERAQQAQLETDREDLRQQPEAGVVPGQTGLDPGAGAEGVSPGLPGLSQAQELARDTDITTLDDWNVPDLRALAARIGVNSRGLRKPQLIGAVRAAIDALRASVPDATAGDGPTGSTAASAAPVEASQEGDERPDSAHVSPAPEASPAPTGPVAEPAAPPAEPTPDPGDFTPLDFTPPAASEHSVLPELPAGADFRQPFRSLSQEAQAVLVKAAVAFSEVHYPDWKEWSLPMVLANVNRSWNLNVDDLAELQPYQLESMWKAVPEPVKHGLAAHYTTEGAML